MKYLVILLILISCGQNGSKDSVKVGEKSFAHLVNQKKMPNDPNLNSEITILNRDYPIEIALYEDHKWFYDLPNLGTGTGEWKFEDGKLKLFAKRTLFNINIDVFAKDLDAKNINIQFFDRFGFESLNMEKTNIK